MTVEASRAPIKSASGSFLRLLAAGCAATAVPFEQVLRDAGIDARALNALEPSIPLAQARQAWDSAARRFGGDDFGLIVAERLPVGAFDLVEHAARASPTWGAALRRVARFGRLVAEGGELSLEVSGNVALFTHRERGALRHVSELMLAYILLRGRSLTGTVWQPQAVAFMHREPEHTATHERIFGCRPRFGEARDLLAFDRAVLNQPLLTSEPSLVSLLDRHAEALLTQLPQTGSLEVAVRRAMQGMLAGGEPRIARVAKSLAMTSRTLQRRLHSEGTAFQAVLDDLRRELAATYLEGQGRSAGEVAFLLGFADPSAFRRAFKRWHHPRRGAARSP